MELDWNAATLRWLNEMMNQGILITDVHLKIRSWNRWLEQHSGKRAVEVVGRDLFEVYPELITRGMDGFFQDALAGQVRVLAHRLHRYLLPLPSSMPAASDYMAQSVQIAPLTHDDQIIGTVTLIEDVTERMAREDALLESNRRLQDALDELKEAQEQLVTQERLAAVGRLAAGLAHEFNNLLAPVILYADMMLKSTSRSDKDREWLTIIRGQGRAAAELIQRILDFGGKAVLRQRDLALSEFVMNLESTLTAVLPPNIRFEMDFQAAGLEVHVDPLRLQQALLNLVLNAREAVLPKGGGQIRLTVSTATDEQVRCMFCKSVKSEHNAWAKIEVADDGEGIPPDVLPHIFEPFFTTRAPQGSGLGLAQVYGIVEQHGGHVDVVSRVGEGARFVLYLPALRPAELLEPTPRADEVLQLGNGETILVVEDDPTMREALVDTLASLNYHTLAAENGRDALRLLGHHQDNSIALVLSDVVMPEMGGVELAREMHARRLGVPVLLLSGHSFKERAEDLLGRLEGLQGWLRKPIDLYELAREVARAIEK